MVELVTRRKKVRYEHIRDILRRRYSRNYGVSRYGYNDAYVGSNTWIFKNGYACQRFFSHNGLNCLRLGTWDDAGNVWFTDGPGYVKSVENENVGMRVLKELSQGNLHFWGE